MHLGYKINKDENNIPIAIDKNDKITKADGVNKGDVKLMQQYIMVAGKLQPALKYIAPNPMFNRYQVENGAKDAYKEIVTYPTVSGDLKMPNRHQGVNFDDRDIPAKSLPKEEVETAKVVDVQDMLGALQKKSISYNKKYY